LIVAVDPVDPSQPAFTVETQELALERNSARSSVGMVVHVSVDQELVTPRDVRVIAEKQYRVSLLPENVDVRACVPVTSGV
jgi:SMC interacting uncharacterized protein involved in chromosome segregation